MRSKNRTKRTKGLLPRPRDHSILDEFDKLTIETKPSLNATLVAKSPINRLKQRKSRVLRLGPQNQIVFAFNSKCLLFLDRVCLQFSRIWDYLKLFLVANFTGVISNLIALKDKTERLQLNNFMDKHQISKKQLAKMIDWIIEVLDIFNQSDNTIFRAILLLKMYMKSCTQILGISDLHLLGVVSMLLASKLEEVKVIKMKSIIVDICKYKFSQQEISKMEKQMIRILSFALNEVSIYEYFSGLFSLLEMPEEFASSVKKYAILLQKMFLYSYDILNVYSYKELASYSTIISMKLYEHSNSKFSAHKYILKVLKFSGIEKNQILDNLNFLRDFASDFQRKFPFNNLQINSECAK